MRQKNLKIHNSWARSAPGLGLDPSFGVTSRMPQAQAFWTARVSTSPSSIRKPKAILESFGSHCVTWTPGLEEETRRTSAFFPFLSSFCGSGGWRRCNPKMSTGYHKGTALGRDKCTWSVTWALGSKFRKSSQLEGETWKKGHAWRTKREVTRFPFPQEIRVLHREAAESTQLAGDRCCHPGWSTVFLRMYSCFPIYYPPSYLHLLPPSTP